MASILTGNSPDLGTRRTSPLLKEFRAQLNVLSKTTGKRYVLSFDSPAYAKNYANIDLKAAAAQVDFLTIDGYDYAGQSSGSRGGIAVSCAGEPPRGG